MPSDALPLRVMLVDDNAPILEMYGGYLKDIGLEVLAASSVLDAMALLERQIPDIVLLDVALGGENGLDILHHIKQRPESRQIPVILLSGCDVTHPDAAACLTKPIAPHQLLEEINKCVGRPAVQATGRDPRVSGTVWPPPEQRKRKEGSLKITDADLIRRLRSEARGLRETARGLQAGAARAATETGDRIWQIAATAEVLMDAAAYIESQIAQPRA